MNKLDIEKLQKYLRKLFGNETIEVKLRLSQTDSVEVYISDEYIGLIYKDVEDGETSYDFQMAILDFDL